MPKITPDPRIVRRLVLVVFVGGIAGMIVGSIADNNGTAITFGLVTAVAAVCLILVTSVTTRDDSVAFDEARAQAMEAQIRTLVAEGADEAHDGQARSRPTQRKSGTLTHGCEPALDTGNGGDRPRLARFDS